MMIDTLIDCLLLMMFLVGLLFVLIILGRAADFLEADKRYKEKGMKKKKHK